LPATGEVWTARQLRATVLACELDGLCVIGSHLRRFLGYGLGELLPAHQTVSEAHSRRFVDGALFERLFLRIVSLCAEHELLDGTHLSVDAFHVEADAALASLRASLALVPAPGMRRSTLSLVITSCGGTDARVTSA
jgi:hypothetical protein